MHNSWNPHSTFASPRSHSQSLTIGICSLQNLKYKNGLNVLESAYMVAIGPTSAMAANRTIEAVLPCAREISRPT